MTAARSAAVTLALVLCGSVSACSEAEPQARWEAPGAWPCGRAGTKASSTASVPTGADRSLQLVTLGRFPFEKAIGFVSVWSHYVGYTPEKKAATVCDLRTGRVRTLARERADSPGVVDWIVGSGDTAVYSRLSQAGDTTGASAVSEWSIHAVDLQSGKRQHVARSKGNGGLDAQYGFLPLPVADGRWVAWRAAPEDGRADSADIVTFDLRAKRLRVVARRMKPAAVGISSGQVVFDADPDGEGRNMYSVPADGSEPPKRLTNVGNVVQPRIANGHVAWLDDSTGRDAVEGPPSQEPAVWVMKLGATAPPVRVGPGFDPVPGAGFLVAHVMGRGLVAYDVGRPGTPAVELAKGAGPDKSARWDVAEDLVVWVEVDDPLRARGGKHLHIARLEHRTQR